MFLTFVYVGFLKVGRIFGHPEKLVERTLKKYDSMASTWEIRLVCKEV